ncbi:hypothetical protein Q9X98_004231 [Vibrio parahaemolyticus]|nr:MULTISPECIES: hypothetical protein [Vibrio harveyi group]ELA7322598.1 hypothetical protein [Vibrio parahaemolyticus]ELJ1804439.1 hypothetical protein [Vibrio parahaemolyticus]MBS9810613.1 hypothetical protein [Vibrio alginolyticus]MCR9484053.1 hypothetical protein [Vibrio alginolyticus]TOJ14051.1 hypothetical protein CGI45_18205 [Vibrio parahaemolyticus]
MSVSAKLREKLAAKKKAIQAASGQRADVLRIPMGKHKFRILPAHPSKGEDAPFWADFGLHYIKGEEKDATSGRNKVKAVYVCVDKTFNKPCDVCAAIEESARHATTDEQLDLIEDAKCKRAEVLVNVLHRSSSDKANVPQIMQMTPTTFEKVINIWEEYQSEGIDIFDPENGVDLVITREGTGLNTKYEVMAAVKSTPIDPSVLDQMSDLQEFVQQEHDEGLKKAINAINATVGILPDRAPKPSSASIEHKSSPKSSVDDDMMDVMDETLAEIEEAEIVEVKKTGTDDVSVGGGDIDDIDELLADLDDL